MENLDQTRYDVAAKRVKEIKGFYTHVVVYVVINIALLFSKMNFNDIQHLSFEYRDFSTAFFWGIGLAAHGLSVFVPSMILGNNWEEKKIKELMKKEKSKNNIK
jgi:2TM domain